MKTINKCLVLNADYTPLNIIDWQKAVKLFLKKKNNQYLDIEFIEFYTDKYVLTSAEKLKLPAVIKINRYLNMVQHCVKFSRKNLFLRDNYTCQYCGITKDFAELTYDHIVPKSQWDYSKGNPTHWLNITTACIKCNRKKGNKNPIQAKMPLINNPYIPKKTVRYLPCMAANNSISIPNEWLVYI
jgi:5-methylcytosine-specific restriction endonuclease McrA